MTTLLFNTVMLWLPIFLPCNYREMVIFLYFLCKIVPLLHNSLIIWSIPMDPKHSVVKNGSALYHH